MQLNNKDTLFAAVNVGKTSTPLATDLSTGRPKTHNLDFWKEVEKVERREGGAALVDMISNSQLGVLIYDAMCKKVENRPPTTARSLQDERLAGIISDLQRFQQDYQK